MGTLSVSITAEEQRPRKRILVCLDRSKFSARCLPYAVAMANIFDADLTLAHVLPAREAKQAQQPQDALSWEISRREAQAYLERVEEELASTIDRPIDLRLEQGHPAERIVDLMRETRADVTVLGSHGEAGITPWDLGSTAQQVLSVTRGSVLVVHCPPETAPEISLKRIMVPLDGSLRTESVLPTVGRMARSAGAEILLAHVVNDAPLTSLHQGEGRALAATLAAHLESEAKRYLARLGELLARDGTSVRTTVLRHPNEREGLLDLSQQEQADLVVVSAHGSACTSKLPFGGVTTYLLNHSLAPVLVLQDLPEPEIHHSTQVDSNHDVLSVRGSAHSTLAFLDTRSARYRNGPCEYSA